MTEYNMTLSTTEPNNYVGLIKMRQGDINTQEIEATITANGQLFKFDGLSVFFNAVLPNGNVIRDKVTEVDYVNSKLNYVVADSFLQEVAQITSWFSFENGNKTIDSTKNFQYSVIAGWKESIPQGNYIYELSEIQRQIEEIIGNKDFTSLIKRMDAHETKTAYLEQVKANQTDLNATNVNVSLNTAKISANTTQISSLASGAPKAASLVSGMTDHTKNYVYTGTESGYTAGNWYYWNGSAWISGGVYQSAGISNHSIVTSKLSFLPLVGIQGKNLFDPSVATLGYYVSHFGYITQNESYLRSDYIPVLPNTSYRISGTKEQLAFYDANKVYISGLEFAESLTTTPANAYFIMMTAKITEINDVQLELGSLITSYEPFQTYFDETTIKSPISKSKLDSTLISGIQGKNLFDPSVATLGYYVSHSGYIAQNESYLRSDYIPVLPNTSYRISGTKEQLAFYDANKVYISGLEFAESLTTTPANAYFIMMTAKITEINDVQLELGSSITSYEPFGYYLDDNSFSKENLSMLKSNIFGSKVINVKKDGTGDFTSLVDALNSISGSSKDNVYDVYIYDDHDMVAELGGQTFIESLNIQENSNRRGVFLPSYVNLHGVNKVRLYGKIDSSWNVNYWTVQAISLLEISAGFNFCENITFDAKNMRYAVHDETNGLVPNTTVKWKDCEFIHRGNSEVLSKGNWTSVVGYGMGSSSGTKRYWDNCIFDSAAFYGFSIHDNANFLLGTQLSFESCEFYNRAGNTEDLKLSTYSTGTVTDLAIINNCILKKIAIINETGLAANRWRVKGSGNTTSSMAEPALTVPTTIQI